MLGRGIGVAITRRNLSRYVLARRCFFAGFRFRPNLVRARTNSGVCSGRKKWGVRGFCSEPPAVSFHVQDYGDFKERVVEADRPVIVDFHADWCGPCRLLGPRLESLVSQREGRVLLAKVNVDDCADLALNFEVEVVPTVMAFKDGERTTDFFTGDCEDEEIDAFINKLLDE